MVVDLTARLWSARRRQRLGHAEADAAVAAGDERHLAAEIEALVGHFPPLSRQARPPHADRTATPLPIDDSLS